MAQNTEQHETRPWGEYFVLSEFATDDGEVVIKKIIVKPNQRLSYQSHRKRSERWFFVQGSGVVAKDDTEYPVKQGSVIEIPVGVKHRAANSDSIADLIFIEISEGQFNENDIIRYEDDYGRMVK